MNIRCFQFQYWMAAGITRNGYCREGTGTHYNHGSFMGDQWTDELNCFHSDNMAVVYIAKLIDYGVSSHVHGCSNISLIFLSSLSTQLYRLVGQEARVGLSVLDRAVCQLADHRIARST